MYNTVQENLLKIKEDIKETALKCGRDENSVRLLAVSKFHPAEAVFEAIKTGHLEFGENRVQEATEKFSTIYKTHPEAKLHIIGHLQRNKVKKACEIACMIESVDSIELLQEIEKQCEKLNKNIEVLLELHTAEDSKSGFNSFEELVHALDFCKTSRFIKPKGLMTMAPLTEDEALIRKSFSTLRNSLEQLKKDFPMFQLTELSMGMSNDYKLAIEEGSTQIRVGTAIFGNRVYQ